MWPVAGKRETTGVVFDWILIIMHYWYFDSHRYVCEAQPVIFFYFSPCWAFSASKVILKEYPGDPSTKSLNVK